MLIHSLPQAVLVIAEIQPGKYPAAEEVTLKGKQDRGKAYVVAVLDDVVTGMVPFAGSQPGAEEEPEEPDALMRRKHRRPRKNRNN